MYTPKRGDVIWLSFDPQSGHEQAGHRPALVLSPEAYNAKTSLAILCPVTNQAKGYPFEVVIPNGSPVSGVILADQVKSMDWRARQAEFFASLPEHVADEVLAKIFSLLS